MKKKLLFIFIIFALAVSCKKEVTIPNGGIYRGVFREIDQVSGDTLADGVIYLALFESSQSYTLSGDTTTSAPATHNGTYLVDNASTMQFSTTSQYSSQYDIDHYLDTVFNYTFDDINFEFWQVWDGKRYEYIMVRD